MKKLLLTVLFLLVSAASARATTLNFDDALRGQQWYLDAMRFPQAWGLIYDLPQRGVVRSAVLDSGFDLGHVDLRENTVNPYNIVTRQNGVNMANSHGTATLGLMAASTGNGTGITRAAFTSPVMPVQITQRSDGSAFLTDMISAIYYAVNNGARVINLSYSGVHQGALAQAALYAKKHGALVFMAAGNDGQTHPNWRNWKWLIAVGSIEPNGQVSSFSSKGKFVDFVAPGRNIVTTSPDDKFSSWSGTSFASPLAASVASLVLTANPELNSKQVLKILRSTATDIGPPGKDDASGRGLLNAEAAVAKAIATKGRLRNKFTKEPILWTNEDLSGIRGIELSNALLYPVNPVPEPGAAALLLLGLVACTRRPSRR